MAENKKSVLLYCDIIYTVEKLSDENAGKLFKHYLKYVNDLNPKPENEIVDLVFEPIKQQLKRDLSKWEEFREKQSENGKKGGRPKKPTLSQKTQAFSRIAKKAVTVTDTVKDTVKDSVISKKFIAPSLEEFLEYIKECGYRVDGENIYRGYEVNNWKDSRDKQIKNWKMKLRQVWFKEENKIIKPENIDWEKVTIEEAREMLKNEDLSLMLEIKNPTLYFQAQ